MYNWNWYFGKLMKIDVYEYWLFFMLVIGGLFFMDFVDKL